jgi:hypothetical protein
MTYAVANKKDFKLLYSSENKVQALQEASKYLKSGIDVGVWYMWNHQTFKNFDRSKLGLISLENLYKQRALQLRDNYDELILYYSGGSDSHNILQTFLKNNIKLDYVFVRWPMKITDKNIYTPNNIDRSAENFVSEWDLVLKNDLDYIKQHHPEIKILVSDWLEDIDPNIYNDDLYKTQNHFHSPVNFLRMQSYSDTEISLLDKGKRVAAIWGVDKPNMYLDEQGRIFFVFLDLAIENAVPAQQSNNNIEFFYITPDMPEIIYEMANQVFLYFKARPELRPIINDKKQFGLMTELVKSICYPYWDSRKFQADKPKGFRKDKDFWFYESSEFTHIVDRWKHYYRNQFDDIDMSLVELDPEGNPSTYKIVYSPQYYVGQM